MKRKLIMNLQLFGLGMISKPLLNADGGAGTGANGGNGDGTGESGEDNNPEGDIKTFDDVLKDKSYQGEFDRRVQKALDTARTKWETENQTKIDEAKTEAEKIAKMNSEQKAKYEEDKRIKDLEKREKEINTRELKAKAHEILSEKKLPSELVEVLSYDTAESCNESIENLEKIWTKAVGSWQEAVEKEVNKNLRGNDIPKGGQSSSNTGFNFNFTGVRPKQ